MLVNSNNLHKRNDIILTSLSAHFVNMLIVEAIPLVVFERPVKTSYTFTKSTPIWFFWQ